MYEKEEGMKEEGSMKKGGVLLIGLCFFILICFGVAWAEEVTKSEETTKSEAVVKSEGQKDYQVFDLGEIFVTSAKPPAVQEMAITNELTPEDFKATNSTTVAEALAYVPGIRVSTGRKNQPLVQIHGLDQAHILVLIDGVPYYESKYGYLDLNEIPVENIAKIEVTKGAASVLYGPNAFVGVINIITKKATEKPSIDGTFEYGPYNYNRESVSHGMKVGIFSYWLSYTHQQADAWSLSNAFVPQIAQVMTRGPKTTTNTVLQDTGPRVNSDYNTNAFWAKVGIDPNPGSEYYLNFHYITRDKGDPPSINGGTTFLSPPASAFSSIFDKIPRYDDWGIDLSGQQKVFDQLTFKGKLFYHNHVDDYESFSDPYYNHEIAYSRFEDYNLGGSLMADVRPLEWDIVRLAFNFRGDSHKERAQDFLPFAPSFSYTGSVGLENEFNLIKNLSVVLGLGYDWFNVTEDKVENKAGTALVKAGKRPEMDNWDPMIGANYNLTDTTRLFGSIARKVRFPTLNDLYTSKGGNPDLKAEKTINYTLGISQSLSKYAKVELAGFYHDISDFISNSANPIQNPLAQFQNYAKIQLIGFEVNAEISPMKDLVLNAGYMFNDARDRSIGAVTSDVTNIPEHKFDVGIHYTIPYITIPYINSATHLDLEGLYLARVFSQVPTPQFPTQATELVHGYFTANARLSTAFLKHFEAYIAVNNLFDKNYQSEYGFPGPGRFVYAGISAKY
jgi:iron complex outermembrane recepter protein